MRFRSNGGLTQAGGDGGSNAGRNQLWGAFSGAANLPASFVKLALARFAECGVCNWRTEHLWPGWGRRLIESQCPAVVEE